MSDFTTYLCAFLVGGAFCVVAQILIDKTMLTPNAVRAERREGQRSTALVYGVW